MIDGNTDTDVKAKIARSSERVFIEKESLVWGTQQGIFLGEFDRPQGTRALVKVAERLNSPLVV